MKNNVFNIILILVISFGFTSCYKDKILKDDEIPTEIRSYIEEHFPNHDLLKAKKERDKNEPTTYEISLSGSISLEFNKDYKIIEIDGITALPNSVIPPPILQYVQENYPNQVITDWEDIGTKQKVRLNEGLELIFDLEGNFLFIDE